MKVTVEEMKRIASESHLTRLFGTSNKRRITIDYIPARPALIVPRPDDDVAIDTVPPALISLTFLLEDQMFGATTYAAITCNGHIVVEPFIWESWNHLASLNKNRC